MEIEEYFNHDELIDFYLSRGIEFNDDREYFHPPVFSYIAKIPDFWKSKGFSIITREEAPAFSECFECPEYINKTCRPEIMLKKVK